MLQKIIADSTSKNNDTDNDYDESEKVYDDESEVHDEDVFGKSEECGGCKTVAKRLYVQCAICVTWWHTNCTAQKEIIEKTEDELKGINFFCCFCGPVFNVTQALIGQRRDRSRKHILLNYRPTDNFYSSLVH